MKTARMTVITALTVLLAVPHATAQSLLTVPARGQKPAFRFTREVPKAAPLPRLDLSPMFEARQDPDPTGLLGLAEDEDAAGASRWIVGGLTFAGIGGAIVYYAMENDDGDGTMDDMYPIGGAFIAVGLGLLVVGTVISLDRGPQLWAGKTPGGVAGGVRIPLGRR